MARREGKARLPWSVKGVTPEARELAKSATSRDGDTMGEWLSDVIRRVGAAQAAGRPIAPPHRRTLPTVPGRRPVADPSKASSEPAMPHSPETVDEAALANLIAERVERTEARLVGLLENLEDIIGRLADRLDRLERGLEQRERDDRTDRQSLPRS